MPIVIDRKVTDLEIDKWMGEVLTKDIPRSTEYIHGMRDRLKSKLAGVEATQPYESGTVHNDAYLAGYEAGKSVAVQVAHRMGWWRGS